MKNIISLCFLLSLLSLLTLSVACNDYKSDNTTFTENDFANDDSLRANPELDVIINFLEHPNSEIQETDTDILGKDIIPLIYAQTLDHTFCWEDEDNDAMHFMELVDNEGNEVLRIDANGECVTEIIQSGEYEMIIHHDGRMERSFPIFIIPNPEELIPARKPDERTNRLNGILSNILKGIHNGITKNVKAQTVGDNINTLFSTNSCSNCNLSGVDFTERGRIKVNLARAKLDGADLSGSILSAANLTEADLSGSDLSEANLSAANLMDVDLIRAILRFAVLRGTDLTRATLREADLGRADLTSANLLEVDLSESTLRNVILKDANLTETVLSGANLASAIWCDGECTCTDPSIGTCTGCNTTIEECEFVELNCPPIEECVSI